MKIRWYIGGVTVLGRSYALGYDTSDRLWLGLRPSADDRLVPVFGPIDKNSRENEPDPYREGAIERWREIAFNKKIR